MNEPTSNLSGSPSQKTYAGTAPATSTDSSAKDSTGANHVSSSNSPMTPVQAEEQDPMRPSLKILARQAKIQHEREMIAKWVRRILHLMVLILSIYLLVTISIDTFAGGGIEDYDRPNFMRTQVYICLIFLLDFFVELFMADKKWKYFWTHFVFLLVSIPYLWIIQHIGFEHITPKAAYLIQYIPLIRGGYALALVVGWLTSNRATNLFLTYLITLLATVYFASLAFFMFEQVVNPNVKTYADALWWAAMDMTTVGSNIVPITPLGRILAVLLAALGTMMFPIFTVYITSLIQDHHRRKNAQQSQSA